jgi:cytochrome c oxidase accessory protein FixG
MKSDFNTTSLGSIREDGSKKTLHPADVSGTFTWWRRVVASVLLVVYITLPWIHVGGFPAVFLDAVNRRFHFFGLTLATQDLWVFFFLVTGLGFSLFYVTALFGRVWCGWTCPYTVFLEHVFRRVERLIDGDASARRQLDKAPWTGGKIFKRVLKHSLYLLFSTTIAHIFLSYFVSIRGLYEMMQQSPEGHAFAFSVVAFLTIVLYFCFSWFREQFCVIMCPYGRLQSALSDDNTVIIGYDKKRGEPRGRANDPNAGDCVSCNRCVQVCPTGIDIRNGLQLECIGCAACVDACDSIMKKLDRKPGLIRYDSFIGLSGGKTKFIRPRILLYSVLLGIGATAFAFAASHISPMYGVVLRMPGSTYFQSAGELKNQFLIRLINKRTEPRSYRFALEGDVPAAMKASGTETALTLPGQKEDVRPLVLSMPVDQYQHPLKMVVRITDVDSGATMTTRPLEFVGPTPKLKDNGYLDPKQYLQK